MAQAATITQERRVPLSISHIGIYVHDAPKMEDFYTRVFGFTVTDRSQARGAEIVFTSWHSKDHHQIILVAGRPKELAYNHINQLSFRVASVENLQAVWRNVKDEPGVTDVRGVDHGNAWSLYFRDPEGNRLEIFCDTQWYIEQPCLEDFDPSLPQNSSAPGPMHSAAPRQASGRLPNMRLKSLGKSAAASSDTRAFRNASP